MKNRILPLSLALTCVATGFSFSGCKKDDVLRINEVTHSVFYAPLYLAESKGYFKDEGIRIEITNGGGADNTMAAVLSGSADIGFCGPEAAIYVFNGGTTDPVKVFAQLTKRDGSFLLGREDVPFDWQDLNGKEILAGRKGGVPAMVFAYTLKQKGITATLNYDVAFNMMTAAYEGGVADYCTMFEPTASAFQKAGKGKILASVGQASGEIPYTCFMAKESYLQKHADKVEGFTRAVTQAVKDVYACTPAQTAEYLKAYFDGTTVEDLATAVENYVSIDAWVTNMAMKKSAFDLLQDVIEDAGELKARVTFEDLVLTQTANDVYTQVYA